MEKSEFKTLAGKLIRKYRIRRGLTLEDLAREARMDDKHLGRAERGQINLSSYTYNKLLKVLEIPEDEIMDIIQKM